MLFYVGTEVKVTDFTNVRLLVVALVVIVVAVAFLKYMYVLSCHFVWVAQRKKEIHRFRVTAPAHQFMCVIVNQASTNSSKYPCVMK